MPRYRVILEFEHPGTGVPIKEHSVTSVTNAPDNWNFARMLPDDISRFITVEVYEERTTWQCIKPK